MIFTYIDKTFAKPIAAGIKRILICLIAVAIMLTMHISPTWQATDTTQAEWHGVTVKPAIVAASKVPQGVIAQIELTINIPAQHEWAKERTGNARHDNDNPSHISMDSDVIIPNGMVDGGTSPVKTFDFQSRGGGWFTTLGEIYHNPWAIPLTFQQSENLTFQILTTEEGITFTVDRAVMVKTKEPSWIRTGLSAGYDGKGNLSANGNLLLWNHTTISAGFRTDNCWQVQAGWLW